MSQQTYPKDIILYCWRGGLRSGAVAQLFSSLGHRVTLIEGGYKAYRKVALHVLHEELPQHNFLVLHGLTGSGKTEILHHAEAEGIPCLDFEGLAQHRGSAFGDFNQRKPPLSQQQFENNLYASYQKQKDAPTFLVEIEGRLGQVNIHPLSAEK